MSCDDCEIVSQCVLAGNTNAYLARGKGSDGSYPLQDDVSLIRVDLFDTSDGERTAVDFNGDEITNGDAAATPEVADVIYDSLQTDERWTQDTVGYNLEYDFATPAVGKQYELRITVTLNNGSNVVFRQPLDSK